MRIETAPTEARVVVILPVPAAAPRPIAAALGRQRSSCCSSRSCCRGGGGGDGGGSGVVVVCSRRGGGGNGQQKAIGVAQHLAGHPSAHPREGAALYLIVVVVGDQTSSCAAVPPYYTIHVKLARAIDDFIIGVVVVVGCFVLAQQVLTSKETLLCNPFIYPVGWSQKKINEQNTHTHTHINTCVHTHAHTQTHGVHSSTQHRISQEILAQEKWRKLSKSAEMLTAWCVSDCYDTRRVSHTRRAGSKVKLQITQDKERVSTPSPPSNQLRDPGYITLCTPARPSFFVPVCLFFLL